MYTFKDVSLEIDGVKIDDGKLCDRIPDTWTAEEIQRAGEIAEWFGSVIDALSTLQEK